ncbi:MAG: DUF432 domain-containing protein [Desulfurococcales archaeon]|nr:DUF432 domain-containing protein [Desulfurococcales archaeon]
MVYGRIDLGEGVDVPGYKIRLNKGPAGFFEYQRLDANGNIVTSSYIYHMRDIRLIPARPMILPEKGIASCIMVDFEKPIHIPPFSSINLETRIITDLAIVAMSGGRYSLVDAFGPGVKPKLAFYGSGREGVVCRYSKGLLSTKTMPGYAATKASIINNTGEPLRVSTIVVPLARMRMYYKPGTWIARASDIVMVIKSGDEAIVNIEDPRLEPGMEASPLSYMGREIALLPTGFPMRWGF